ncbi:MAG: hypothetical protein LBT96_05395 [Campylobacteraceae bacterium]|jgi:hypothetical protein|nr:hypothetical protein [Campylobacteraceae bacterium]
MNNVDTQDIMDYSQDYSSIFDNALSNSDEYTQIDTSYTNNTNQDDTRTMTEEQYNANQAQIKENENSLAGKALNTVLSTTKDVLEAINAPAEFVNNSISFIKGHANAIKNTILIAGALAGAYFALGIVANAKRNIKTLKGKK